MFGFIKQSQKVDNEKVEKLLTRGVERIFPNSEFLKSKLIKGEKVTLYLGIDPTGPTLHLGHVIPLKKLGEFQQLGHKIILLIGDFTAMIGDPTDKKATRKVLTKDEVLENLKEYKKQASRFISFNGGNAAEMKFNSSWLSKMNFVDVVNLASNFTVQQMLERDMFAERMKEGKPISLHEFMYPLMQGYDSVAMDVDGEIGGNDQTWNMLAGRDLMKNLKNKEKFVLATKLLVDTTGKKMGKSEGNMVALNQTPVDMFGKVMSWSDDLIIPGFTLVTHVGDDEIEQMKGELESGKNPRDMKVRLAYEVVSLCIGEKEAQEAQKSFEQTFSKGGIPENLEEIEIAKEKTLMEALVAKGVVDSNTDYRRLVGDGAITHMDSDTKVEDSQAVAKNGVYRIGKKRFVKIKII